MNSAKLYLSRYKVLVVKIRILEQDIDKLIAKAGGGSVSGGDGLPHGNTTTDQTGAIASRLADIKAKRDSMLFDSIVARDEIEQTILKVPDPVSMQLLFDRYVKLMRWNDVAEDLHIYNEQYVRGRLHGQALAEVQKIIG